MNRKIAIITILGSLGSVSTSFATTETFNSSTTWIAPAGVTNVQVEVYGGGGAGGTNISGDNGGGGGAYSKLNVATVTPGVSYTVDIGSGGIIGTPGTSGGPSWFISMSSVMAPGGFGSSVRLGGSSLIAVGDVKFSGGNGGVGLTSGGGGGSSGGTGQNGQNGGNGDGIGANGGLGGFVTGSGAGGNGGADSDAPFDGSPPGGGGGGSGANGSLGKGNGANGRVILTYATASSTPPRRIPFIMWTGD